MDKQKLTALRSKLYATEAYYTSNGYIADLQWRVGNNDRFEIYYTNAAGWSAVHVLAHETVMDTTHANWLIGELAADGITMTKQDAERILQQYSISTTANWHPHLPKLIRAVQQHVAA